MQIRVLSIKLTGNEPAMDFDRIFEKLPEPIRERTLKYKVQQEQHLKIVGKGLLMKALEDWNIPAAVALEQLRYTATQQPYIEGMAVQLSISHSDDLIACAVARSAKIGIDVEKIKPVKLALMRAYLDDDTWQAIVNGPDPDSLFFRHWTIREAAIKASGLGLEHADLASVTHSQHTINVSNQVFHYRMLPLSHAHASCIASDQEITNIEMTSLTLSDLF